MTSIGNPAILATLPPFAPTVIRSGVDRYGFSSVLARYCGRPKVPRSFSNWMHGWIWAEAPTSELLMCYRLPRDVTIVVRNEVEQKALESEGFKDVRIGGLPFAYIEQQHDLRSEDALLAFPPHSAERERLTSEQAKYFDYLESLKPDFEEVFVSVHYLDIGSPLQDAAMARGLKIIPGARPDDANSLYRSRATLDSFEHVTSNVMGSHVLYALFADCKFSFGGPIYEYDALVLMGIDNPIGHTAEYLDMSLYYYSEMYLRKRFGHFFVGNPREGLSDRQYAGQAIGEDFKMAPREVEDALGWGRIGQVKGYCKGAWRRLRRSLRVPAGSRV